ncbi:hypothetical protein D9619_002617 [Psilocybe cf. subviscida]|uniref:Ceramidase n=1 Tax=Psilocybe cf. subviscida TaxID=2480587 RepID=A0A8H5AXR9_9AGAR|nr:hypothetical protein D9619_002617 [Psilocybe cf. subviscida]
MGMNLATIVPWLQKTGAYGPVTSTLDWCEINHQFSPYIAEMANSVSNLFTIFLGVLGHLATRREAFPTRFSIGYLGIILVGVGSVLFHSTLLFEAQLADELPMIYVTAMNLFVLFDDVPGFGIEHTRSKVVVGTMLAFDAFFSWTYIVNRNPIYHQVVFASLLFVTAGRVTSLLRRPAAKKSIPDVKRAMIASTFTRGALVFAFAFFVWNLDNIFCGHITQWKLAVGWPAAFLLEGHSWWHIFTGLGSYYMFIGIHSTITRRHILEPQNANLGYISLEMEMDSSSTLTCAHTTVQFVNAASPWPDHVASITDGLQLSMPASVDKLDSKDFSIQSVPLHRELMASRSSLPRFEPNASVRPVTDILDTVLFFVAKLRFLQASAPETDRAMESVALTLFDVLGSLCSDDIVLIDGPQFLLPRSLPPKTLQQLGFEGRALLLFCVVIDEISKEGEDDGRRSSDSQNKVALPELQESRILSSPTGHSHSSVTDTSPAMDIEKYDSCPQQFSSPTSCEVSEEMKLPLNHDRTPSDIEIESGLEGSCNSKRNSKNQFTTALSGRRASSAMEIDQVNCSASTAFGSSLKPPPKRDTRPSREAQLIGGSPQGDLETASNEDEAASERRSAVFSAKSASEMAADDEHSWRWLFAKGTMLLSVTALKEVTEAIPAVSRLAPQIGANVTLYESLVSMPDWPQHWIDGTGLELGCSTAHKDLRDEFIQQIQQISLKEGEDDKQGQPTATVLSDDQVGFRVLASQLSAFLAAISIAQRYDNNLARKFSVLEAETRRPWDNILDIACSHEGDNLWSANLLLERTISLPKDTLVDKGKLSDFLLVYDVIAANQLRIHATAGPQHDVSARANLTSYLQCAFRVRGSLASLEYAPPKNPGNAKADAFIISPFNLGAEIGTDQRPEPQKLKLISPIKSLLKSASKNETKQPRSRSPSPSPASGMPNYATDSKRLIVLTFAAEYKKSDKTLNQALNQCCFYLVALLMFLKSLGIVDAAVYGVVAWGSKGTILMAWHDSPTGYNFIFREATAQYDLTNPLDAFKFGMAIHRIYREQLRLVDRLEAHGKQAELLAATQSSMFNDWEAPPSRPPPSSPYKSTASDGNSGPVVSSTSN